MSLWSKRFFISLASFGLLAVGGAQAQNGPSVPGTVPLAACVDPDTSPEEFSVPCLAIVGFQEGVSAGARANAVRGAGAVVRFNYSVVNATAVLVPNEFAYRALADDPNVVAIHPDLPARAHPKPPDKPGGGKKDNGGNGQVVPSGVDRIFAAPDDSLGVTGAGVGVAIFDGGLDFGHADLDPSSTCFTAFDAVSNEVTCQDDDGHGTHVGGTVAALDNAIDVVGVAPEATPYAVKVLDNGIGPLSAILAGIQWVAKSVVSPPIRVANMSLGGDGSCTENETLSALLLPAIQTLTNAGIAVVVSAGNVPNAEVKDHWPASCPEVMAVASTTAEPGDNKCRLVNIAADTASYFTTDGAFDVNTGVGVTISAPGERRENINRGCTIIRSEGILSLALGGGTTRKSGTSMSAPHVAGVVALMWERTTTLDPETIRDRIRNSAQRIGEVPLDSPTSSYTYDGELEGIVDAACAVNGCP